MCNCRCHVQFFFLYVFFSLYELLVWKLLGVIIIWELLSFGIVSFEVIGLLLFLSIADLCMLGWISGQTFTRYFSGIPFYPFLIVLFLHSTSTY
jgi:hypothetical protein